MPNINSILSKLKSTVIQTQTKKIDAKLDQAVKDIVSYRSHSGRNGYIELVRNLISKTSDVKISGASGGLFSQGVSPTAFGQGARIARYNSYQAIITQINYAQRALDVLVDNILSPDDITKQTLEIKPKMFLVDETPVESKVRYTKEVVKEIDLERRLDLIVRSTLLFGDLFCELGGPKTALTSQTMLNEAVQYEQMIKDQYKDGTRQKIIHDTGNGSKYEFNLDFSSLSEAPESVSQDMKKEKSKVKKLANLHLIFHDPQFVVKLQSAMFPICFGYLVFPIKTVMAGAALSDEAINNICVSIIKSLHQKIPQMSEFKDDKELKDILTALVSNADLNHAMDIRYVPPDKMVHFMRPTTKYYPYGESIFDSTQYSSKVLVSLETALAVQRLSKSTEKRKIAIEVGLPRDARKAIEMMKEEFRKRKVSLDSFGSVDTIPSMITTFEDVYIPQKDGKPFVDISTFSEGNVDVRSKVDELKFMRDQMVASYGVPPSFIGIEENLSNKSALSEENILFARTVIGHQKYLTHQITELVQKIFDIIDPEEALTIIDHVEVSLPVPRSLQFEREARYMNELSTLVENLERIGIPKEYSTRKYLSQIDWEEVKKYDIDQKINKNLDPEKKKEDQDQMGMGGLDMGGEGGFGGGL
ncbi:MAG: portal protein [Vallitaleaceae bacterium]|nr:portal protein [Vallitaleaceae bacterium]